MWQAPMDDELTRGECAADSARSSPPRRPAVRRGVARKRQHTRLASATGSLWTATRESAGIVRAVPPKTTLAPKRPQPKRTVDVGPGDAYHQITFDELLDGYTRAWCGWCHHGHELHELRRSRRGRVSEMCGANKCRSRLFVDPATRLYRA